MLEKCVGVLSSRHVSSTVIFSFRAEQKKEESELFSHRTITDLQRTVVSVFACTRFPYLYTSHLIIRVAKEIDAKEAQQLVAELVKEKDVYPGRRRNETLHSEWPILKLNSLPFKPFGSDLYNFLYLRSTITFSQIRFAFSAEMSPSLPIKMKKIGPVRKAKTGAYYFFFLVSKAITLRISKGI